LGIVFRFPDQLVGIVNVSSSPKAPTTSFQYVMPVQPSSCTSLAGVFYMGFREALWQGEEGQDVAEYAVMLSIIVMIAIATVRFIGSGADNTFSAIASTIR